MRRVFTFMPIMQTAEPIEPIVLVYRPRGMKPLERALAAMLALSVIAALAYAMRWEIFSAEQLRSAASMVRDYPLALLPVVIAALAACLVPAKMRRTRITVDGTGMQMRVTLPVLGDTSERKVTWDKVSSVSYVPETSMLALRVRRGAPWVLRAGDWSRIDASGSADPHASEPDLVRIVRRLGLLERKSAAAVLAQFDVLGDSRTRLLVVLGAVAGLYAALDGMMNPESWAFFDVDYLLPHAIVALAAAACAAAWLTRRVTAPALDRNIVAGMALFVAVVCAPASYVAGIRVNQWVAGPLVAHEYHRDASCMNLVPTDASLPVIEYTELTRAFWCRLPQAKSIQVLVRRGLFGLYQVNLAPQTDEIRRFRGGS